MRRIIAALLTICLVFAPFPAFSFVADQEGHKPVVIASGTVAANLLRFSNATGAYFVDTDDATLAAALAAAVKHNDIIEVLDGSKRAIRFVAKEQGAGETLDDAHELVVNGNGESAAGWTVQGAGASVAITGGGQVGNCFELTGLVGTIPAITRDIATTAGMLLKHSLYIKAGTTGNKSVSIQIGATGGGNPSISSSTVTASGIWTQYSQYGTALTTVQSTYFRKNETTAGTALFDEDSIKQVLTPSTSGVIAAKYPGGADGFSNVAASFDYNSATGYTWNVISSVPNGRTVYSNAITSSAMHVSMVAGTAFFFHDTLDFSSFAVGPSGKYMIAMYDSAGRVAWGYGKAAGTGETLSATELLTGFTNDATYPFSTFTTSGRDISDLHNTVASFGGAHSNVLNLTAGRLNKLAVTGVINSGSLQIRSGSNELLTADPKPFATVDLIAGANAIYGTVPSSAAGYYIGARDKSQGAFDGAANGWSYKQVLTPPVTGLTITSTPDGETYNWAQITTGFDANAVKSVNVWRAF